MTPTASGDFFSVAVASDGSYGIPAGTMFSYPIRSSGNGQWEVVKGLELAPFAKEKIAATLKELQEEMDAVKSLV